MPWRELYWHRNFFFDKVSHLKHPSVQCTHWYKCYRIIHQQTLNSLLMFTWDIIITPFICLAYIFLPHGAQPLCLFIIVNFKRYFGWIQWRIRQTWNLSKNLHRRILRLKILHRQFHLISTVLVGKNTKNEWKWRNLLRWQKFYTAAGTDGMDKFHLWTLQLISKLTNYYLC